MINSENDLTGGQMDTEAFRIRIPDLTKLDELELRKQLGAEALEMEESEEGHETHGELATATAVVIVSLAALRVLAAWLSKPNRRARYGKTIEIVAPDGTRHTVTVQYEGESADSPDPKVLEQLAKACGVDLSTLGKM